jgi:hypothetical protein
VRTDLPGSDCAVLAGGATVHRYMTKRHRALAGARGFGRRRISRHAARAEGAGQTAAMVVLDLSTRVRDHSPALSTGLSLPLLAGAHRLAHLVDRPPTDPKSTYTPVASVLRLNEHRFTSGDGGLPMPDVNRALAFGHTGDEATPALALTALEAAGHACAHARNTAPQEPGIATGDGAALTKDEMALCGADSIVINPAFAPARLTPLMACRMALGVARLAVAGSRLDRQPSGCTPCQPHQSDRAAWPRPPDRRQQGQRQRQSSVAPVRACSVDAPLYCGATFDAGTCPCRLSHGDDPILLTLHGRLKAPRSTGGDVPPPSRTRAGLIDCR